MEQLIDRYYNDTEKFWSSTLEIHDEMIFWDIAMDVAQCSAQSLKLLISSGLEEIEFCNGASRTIYFLFKKYRFANFQPF